MKAYPASRSWPSLRLQRRILSSIILASLMLSVMTDVSLGDGPLMFSSLARRTAAMMDAAITEVEANLSVMRFCSSIAFVRSRSSRAIARLIMPNPRRDIFCLRPFLSSGGGGTSSPCSDRVYKSYLWDWYDPRGTFRYEGSQRNHDIAVLTFSNVLPKNGGALMEAKSAARQRFDSARDRLVKLSHRIHANPEIGFEEEKASTWLCEALNESGFAVEKGICDLLHSFPRSRRLWSSACWDLRRIRLPARYRPCVRPQHHCCLGRWRSACSGHSCRRTGPHHQRDWHARGGGVNASGKILLLERGAFEGINAAMMVHPAPFDMLRAKIIAASMFEVQCTGKESHASAFPELGVNAATL